MINVRLWQVQQLNMEFVRVFFYKWCELCIKPTKLEYVTDFYKE